VDWRYLLARAIDHISVLDTEGYANTAIHSPREKQRAHRPQSMFTVQEGRYEVEVCSNEALRGYDLKNGSSA